MDKLIVSVRVLLGLAFLVFGLNGFMQFLPMPEMADPAGEFIGAMAATGYFLPMVKGFETVLGGLLLVGLFAPAAVLALLPISVNIVMFHLMLDPGGIGPGIVLLGLHLILIWGYWDYYRQLTEVRARP